MQSMTRGFTWLDLMICTALAVPYVSSWTLEMISLASVSLGSTEVALLVGPGAFFVNLAGLFGVLWNIAMLRLQDPSLHRIDLIARVGVISLIALHVSTQQLPTIFFFFLGTEIVGGAFKIAWLRSLDEDS